MPNSPKTYRKSFQYTDAQDTYELRLKKPFPWWLLLLLLPLLLLIRCSRDVEVVTVDKAGEVVPEAAVALSYREIHLFKDGEFLYNHLRDTSLVTDAQGRGTFEDVRYSFFSFVFHHRNLLDFNARKGIRHGHRAVVAHHRFEKPLPIVLGLANIQVEVRSGAYDTPLPGAQVDVTIKDKPEAAVSGTTGPDGRIPVGELEIDDVVERIRAGRRSFSEGEFGPYPVAELTDSVIVVRLGLNIDNVDIVLCIDATGSMDAPLSQVKQNALAFHTKLEAACRKYNKNLASIRLRPIIYRDLNVDAAALSSTAFLQMPGEEKTFRSFIQKVYAGGGGDEPESGLEAVSMALNSDWRTEGEVLRQIIVVWTDASAHPIHQYGLRNPQYPKNVPATFEELTRQWNEGALDSNGDPMRRIVLFAPEAVPWLDIASSWRGAMHRSSNLGRSVSTYDFDSVIDAIAEQI